MKTLRFTGYSDDTLIENVTGVSYDNCANGTAIVMEVKAGRARVRVVGNYAPPGATETGCWIIGLQPADEGVPVPSWPVRFYLNPERNYSIVMEMDVPDNATVRVIEERELAFA